MTPVPVKNDPFAIFFVGNHPIWLPYDASDPYNYNAAFWLADLEIAFPVAVADRRSVPLFPGDCDDRSETAPPRQGAGECRMAAKIWA